MSLPIFGINSGQRSLTASLSRIAGQLAASNRRLATNSRITSAADDPVGFSQAVRLRAQISGYQAARGNIQSGSSMVEVTGDGLSQARDILGQIRQLADSWNNGSGNKTDIQAQVTQLNGQLQSVISSTSFGSTNVLMGGPAVTLQVGPNASDTMSVTNPDMNAIVGGAVSTFQSAPTSATINTAQLDTILSQTDQAIGQSAAYASRLKYAGEYADTQTENLMRADDRIEGLDVAAEMTKQTALMIRQSFNTALLAQSSQQQRSLAQLLWPSGH